MGLQRFQEPFHDGPDAFRTSWSGFVFLGPVVAAIARWVARRNAAAAPSTVRGNCAASFTSASARGSRGGAQCGRRWQSRCLERGGKYPLVVAPDA